MVTDKDDLVCQQAVEMVTDYLECALSGPARRRLERHLDGCPQCARYLRQMQVTIDAIGGLEQELLTDDARAKLVELYHPYRDGWSTHRPRPDTA